MNWRRHKAPVLGKGTSYANQEAPHWRPTVKGPRTRLSAWRRQQLFADACSKDSERWKVAKKNTPSASKLITNVLAIPESFQKHTR